MKMNFDKIDFERSVEDEKEFVRSFLEAQVERLKELRKHEQLPLTEKERQLQEIEKDLIEIGILTSDGKLSPKFGGKE